VSSSYASTAPGPAKKTPPPPRATYSGLTTIYGLVPASAIPAAQLASLAAYASIRTHSPHAGLFAVSYARADRSCVHWFSSRTLPAPTNPINPTTTSTPNAEVEVDVSEPDTARVRGELLATYGAFPAPIPALITHTSVIRYWPVHRLAPLPTRWYSRAGRIVLVGDAAHAMPPHAAQGVGMGVEDALLVAAIVAKLAAQVHTLSSCSSCSSFSSSSPREGGRGRVSNTAVVVQPSAALWAREYQRKRAARVARFVAHAEAQGRARTAAGPFALALAGRLREWLLWAAFPAINTLARVHGLAASGVADGEGGGRARARVWAWVSKALVMVGLGDVQGWGYDPDDEEVSLEGL
jgi:hypothetical protein